MGDTLGYRVLKEIDPEYIKNEVDKYVNEHPDTVKLTVVVDWLGDCIYINPAEVNGYHLNFCTIVNVLKKDTVKDTYIQIMEEICQQTSL